MYSIWGWLRSYKDNKEEILQREMVQLNWFIGQEVYKGYLPVCTDGFSKRYDLIGSVGGFGVFVAPPYNIRCSAAVAAGWP